MKRKMVNVLRWHRFIAPLILMALYVAACGDNATGPTAPGALTTLAITPDSVVVAVGGTQQFAVTGKDANGNEVTVTPTWSVMNGGGSISISGMFTAGLASGIFANTIRVSSGGVVDSVSVTVSASVLATLTIAPTTATMPVGGTHQFTAKGTDANGNEVAISPDWLTTSGTITTSGVFTAGTEAGTFPTSIRVSSGSVVSDYTAVTITPGPLATIVLDPNPVRLLTHTTQQFVATGRDGHGNVVSMVPTWSVGTGSGSITSSGLFTAGAQTGTFVIGASNSGISGNGAITVASGALAAIAIAPNPAISMAIGSAQQFAAVGRDTEGNDVAIAPVWSVVNGGGTISDSGLFTAGADDGIFFNTIAATSGNITSTLSVTVNSGILTTIAVNPSPVVLAIGGTRQFVATGKDASGNVITISPIWSVANGGGTISSSGLFTAGTNAGTFSNTVVATRGGVSGTATVTVSTGALVILTVSPNPVTLPAGGTQQFVATGKDASGNEVSFTPNWEVVAGGGSIDAQGLFRAGTVAGVYANTVRAISAGFAKTVTVTVTVP